MIDWARISELRDEIGAEDFEEVVELFLSEVEERLDVLSADKPIPEQEEDMHFLKGSAMNLGFDQLAALCHEGEKSANSGVSVTGLKAIIETYETSKSEFLSKFDTTRAA
ncbi:Hpt domain-containing protein [Planktotalea sp.]|uniref:Hpt domain-containing protein n=1 Tax=Planktotalea sp. TaxID=2029877 RepID=UPI003296FCFA